MPRSGGASSPAITFAPTRQSIRRENVTQLAIRIFNKSDARGAIRVVLDRGHFCGDAAFAPFEINLAIFLFMTAADVTRSQPAVVIAAAAVFFFGSIRLFVGFDFVISSKAGSDLNRSVGVSGRKFLSAITN